MGKYVKWCRFPLDVSTPTFKWPAGDKREVREYRVLFHITLFPPIKDEAVN
jgi:hypothetical protein